MRVFTCVFVFAILYILHILFHLPSLFLTFLAFGRLHEPLGTSCSTPIGPTTRNISILYIYINIYVSVCLCGGQILLYIDICIYKSGVHTWAKKRVALRKLFFEAFVRRIGDKRLEFFPFFGGFSISAAPWRLEMSLLPGKIIGAKRKRFLFSWFVLSPVFWSFLLVLKFNS